MKRRLAFLYITLFIHIGVWAGNVIDDVRSINPSTVEVLYANGKTLTIDFYDNNIFRLFKDDNGGVLRDPIADPPAQILVDNPSWKTTGEKRWSDVFCLYTGCDGSSQRERWLT